MNQNLYAGISKTISGTKKMGIIVSEDFDSIFH